MDGIDDYDDQLLGCNEQLRNDNEWTRRFEHIIIDEYQDNNYLHTQIAKQLSSKAHITIVGDPDQTINTFQGSNTANFEDFNEYYNCIKPVKKISLVQNYRSSKNIIDISNQFIKKITDPRRMELITYRGAENPIKIIRCNGEKGEFDFLYLEIKKIEESGCKLSEVGVLARSNKKAREINDFLLKKGIDSKFKKTEEGFVTVGTVHFFKGAEYKIIFIFDVMDKTFPTSFKNSELKVPISMRHYKPKLSNEEEHYNEERRIFYVAMTRAKDELFIITKISQSSKDFVDSEYVNEMAKKPQIAEIEFKINLK
jgi:superfamily I DNA/RNA helicase